MAIIKVVEAPNGATGEYNSMAKVEIFPASSSVVITTNIFADEAAKLEGKNILWVERTSIPFLAFTQDPRNAFYDVLNDYSYSPFKGGVADEETSGDNTIQLTPEAMVDVDYGSTIPPYTPDASASLMFDPWDKSALAADGVDTATISNLPNPTTFRFLKTPASVGFVPPITEESGSFGFTTTAPGVYTIQADSFGYFSSIINITAS